MFLRAHTDSEMGVHYDVAVGVHYGMTSLFLQKQKKSKGQKEKKEVFGVLV